MKETFTEKEYQEITKFYNKEVLKNHYENKDNYTGYEGYKNLNDCNLSKEEFELFWKIQELLSTYDLVKNQLNNNLYDTLENIKTLYIDVLEEKI